MRSLYVKGINSVCYDTYGTGNSDQLESSETISIDILERQLSDFLSNFSGTINKKNILLGTSAGACLSANYAVKNKSHVKQIAFISPAIDISEKFGFLFDFGIWILKKFPNSSFLKKRIKLKLLERTESVIDECPKQTQDYIRPIVKKESKKEGYSWGFHRKILGGVFGDCKSAFNDLVVSDIPFFAVSGNTDRLADFELFQKTFKSNKTAKDYYEEFKAGHGLQCAKFDQISEKLIQFILTDL